MDHINNTLIPERLKSARENLNLSKAEAARKIGLTAASYVRYEAGDRSPSPQVLQSIAEKLGTSVPFLSGETDDISPVPLSFPSPKLFLHSFYHITPDVTIHSLYYFTHPRPCPGNPFPLQEYFGFHICKSSHPDWHM